MEKIKLAVIFGGKSSEYSVSLHSAESLLSHCDQNKYELILIGITEEGQWLHYPKLDFEAVAHDTWHQDADCREVVLSPSSSRGLLEINESGYQQLPVDVIFPCLHGPNGEDGTIQGLFELADIPYVGCGPLASSCGMDKEFTHILCENAGVVCAPYLCVYQENQEDLSDIYQNALNKLGLPMFIKPANAGSSYGISKISNEEEFIKGIEFAFNYDHKVLVEAAIDGFEIGCAVLGNHELIVGECDEIDTKNSFFDFAAKYALENTQIHCPARISKELSDKAKEIAKKVYRTMNCSGMCRVDMFINSKQEIIFNEVNTIPGFTATSRYPSMMKAAGITFNELIDRLVQLALEK